MTEEKKKEDYPLWCVDRGDTFDSDERYAGPFLTKADAEAAYRRDDSGTPHAVVRACRRARPSELEAASMILDAICESQLDTPGFPGWQDPAKRDAVEEAERGIVDELLKHWADRFLVTNMYVCEGDE